jgi:tyrosyl-tRNA synthetase
MGKTSAGTVWLDPDRTSPYEYYQFWMNTEDPDVERFLALFTLLDMAEVRRLGQLEGADLNQAKEVLAFEATRLTHGENAATAAQDASRALFGGEGQAEAAPTTTVTQSAIETGLDLADLLVETGLAASKRAARDLVRQGGAYVNGERMDDVTATLGPEHVRDGQILLRAGKKRYHRLAIQL